MIDRELANEAARNQLRAQLPDLTEAQVRHKGKMIAGAVLSTVQAPSRAVARDLIEAAVRKAQARHEDRTMPADPESVQDFIVDEIFAALDGRAEAVSRSTIKVGLTAARAMLNEAPREAVRDEEAGVNYMIEALTQAIYGPKTGAVDRDLIAGLIPLGFTERDPYANVYEAADTIIAALPSAVVDRDALAAHLASVRWDNAATRMDREKFWRQRADEAIAAACVRSEAEVKAEALREAAAEMRRILEERKTLGDLDEWLLARADLA